MRTGEQDVIKHSEQTLAIKMFSLLQSLNYFNHQTGSIVELLQSPNYLNLSSWI